MPQPTNPLLAAARAVQRGLQDALAEGGAGPVLIEAAIGQLSTAIARTEVSVEGGDTPLLRDLAVHLRVELRMGSLDRDSARRLLGRVQAELDERQETALDAIGRAAS